MEMKQNYKHSEVEEGRNEKWVKNGSIKKSEEK